MFQLLLDLITYPVQDADMDHIGLIANIYFHPKLSSSLDHIKERYLIGVIRHVPVHDRADLIQRFLLWCKQHQIFYAFKD
mgnify:CR=1 FL=1